MYVLSLLEALQVPDKLRQPSRERMLLSIELPDCCLWQLLLIAPKMGKCDDFIMTAVIHDDLRDGGTV